MKIPMGGGHKIFPPQGLEKWGGNIWGGGLPPHPFWVPPHIYGGIIMNMGGGEMGEMGGEIMKFVPPHHFRFG